MPSNTPAEAPRPSAERRETILVVEDEPGILDFLRRGLSAHGYEVLSAVDGITGTELALQKPVNLVVLDLMLPQRGGLEVLTRLRAARPELPVIALTARAEVEDRVRGLDAGAVDYLTKPFSLSELAARIRAQLRIAGTPAVTVLTQGDIEIDLITRQVRRAGHEVRLSTTEFELLAHLMRNRGQVMSREQLLRGVWGYDYDPGTNVVDVYVGYLRRKLTVNGCRPPIVTIRAVGYRLDGSPPGA